MAPRNDLPISNLHELFEYEPETGVLRWKSGRRSGLPAGKLNRRGYRILRFNGREYLAHRVAWAIFSGAWPTQQIDHVNGVLDDNRRENLRDVSAVLNQQNQRRPRRDNKTGFLGVAPVVYESGVTRYGAYIRYGGKQHGIGTFDTPEEAHAAYLLAKRTHHTANTL